MFKANCLLLNQLYHLLSKFVPKLKRKMLHLSASTAFGTSKAKPHKKPAFCFTRLPHFSLNLPLMHMYFFVVWIYLQPAPRARLLSLCTVTLESFRVSLSMALRRPGYSDWSIGYMPEGQKNKRQSAHQGWNINVELLGKLWLHLMFH